MATLDFNNLLLKNKGINESVSQSAKLEASTRANYNAAIAYYAQKKLNFLNYVSKKEEQASEEVAKTLARDVRSNLINTWKTQYNQILSVLDIGDFKSGFSYEIADVEGFEKLKITKELRDQIRRGAMSGPGKNKNIYSLLGFEYEKYIVDACKQALASQKELGLAQILNEFQVTGASKSKSAMRSDMRDIRPDLGLGFELEARSDGVLYSKQGNIPVELQIEMNISSLRKEGKTSHSFETLQAYANANMYGISVKTWASSPANKKITDISGLKDKINTLYKNQKKPISSMYAAQIMNHEVSNYIFNILGLVNVAFITGKKMIWTDEFLENYLLTMNLGSRNKYMSKTGLIRPEIQENGVYARAYKMGNAIKQQASILSAAHYDNVAQGLNQQPTHQVKYSVHSVKKSYNLT